MSDLKQSSLEILTRWIVACDRAEELRRQRNRELDPPEPEVGFMGDDLESAPSHLAYVAALREKHNASRAMRRFARRLVVTEVQS